MAGPKPLKKPKPKPIKHSNGMYSFIDCEDTFAVGTEIFQWDELSEQYIEENAGTHTLESGQDFEVDNEGKISNIY
jgi:hypothetical protein